MPNAVVASNTQVRKKRTIRKYAENKEVDVDKEISPYRLRLEKKLLEKELRKKVRHLKAKKATTKK